MFFVGGFETSATTLQFALYELSKNQDVQDKLRDEIVGKIESNNGEVTYECVQEMGYLDRVVSGTWEHFSLLRGY